MDKLVCVYCKKRLTSKDDTGYHMMTGYFHNSCAVKKSGVFGSVLSSSFFKPEIQSDLLLLALGLVVVGILSMVAVVLLIFLAFGGVFNDLIAFLAIAALGITVLVPMLYGMYTHHKDRADEIKS